VIHLAGNAILGTIRDCSNSSTAWSFAGEIVERVGKILQIRQLVNTSRNNTCETVVCNVELLDTLHVSNAGR
jgi:hypothetical protein